MFWRFHLKSPFAEAFGAFYTGKPYEPSSEGYLFKYRGYNPELNRWASVDPSGFPDGANQYKYFPTPTAELDFGGLWTIKMTTTGNDGDSVYHWNDKTGANGADLHAGGTITVSAAPGQTYTSITMSGTAIAFRDGAAGVQIDQTYTISVSQDGKLTWSFGSSSSADKADSNVHTEISIAGTFTGNNTSSLSFDYQVGGTYYPFGITGFTVGANGSSGGSGGGGTLGLNWTAPPNAKVTGNIPTISFEAVE